MKTLLLILCLIVIPEPIMLVMYLFMKKYYPNHRLTLYLAEKLDKVKQTFIMIKNKIVLNKEPVVVPIEIKQ